ncbi:MAG: galactose-phosphate uridylyltransferase [Bryobacterales bacterium]|jgi:UDPglucose--hexose-1-phosphate uridylyltransferase|nr:galactose-phosphate uridylyltransferase [Bryobacterales bacterium]
MQKLRWHALLQQWVAVSTARQNRPQMPANWCPFDPGSGKVPDDYDVYLYPNDFPAFAPDVEPFDPHAAGLFGETGPRGACDVVLYSPEHTLPPSQLSVANWRKVIDVWTARTAEHATNPDIALVAVFENCGEAVGVTMPHPHGQIYAMPFVSPNVQKELASAKQHADSHGGECLLCSLIRAELQDTRVVAENENFAAFVPFAARFPAEIWICAKRHMRTLIDLTDSEKNSLAEILSIIRKKYDNLYGFLMPLMMAVKQAPLRERDVPYHFHLQFLPLQRSPNKLKYLATIETGYGTFLADTLPEDMAEQMRRSEPATQPSR